MSVFLSDIIAAKSAESAHAETTILNSDRNALTSKCTAPQDLDSLQRIFSYYSRKKWSNAAMSPPQMPNIAKIPSPAPPTIKPAETPKIPDVNAQPIMPTTGLDAAAAMQQQSPGNGRNVIDMYGPIDRTGGTVDGNHAFGIAKSPIQPKSPPSLNSSF